MGATKILRIRVFMSYQTRKLQETIYPLFRATESNCPPMPIEAWLLHLSLLVDNVPLRIWLAGALPRHSHA